MFIYTFINRHRKYILGYKDGGVFVLVEYYGNLPKELSDEERHKFVREERIVKGQRKKVYVLKAGKTFRIDRENLKYYTIFQPLNFRKKNLRSRRISIQKLAKFLKDKRILFFTGAGISTKAGIFDTKNFVNHFKIDLKRPVDGFLRKIITNPEQIILSLMQFIMDLSRTGQSTPAHKSLKRLSLKLNAKIFTDNKDNLHERTNSKIIHITPPWVKRNIKEQQLKKINVICTIGLKRDNLGFLGWYKRHNPKGIIVAINNEQPSYLDRTDIFLKGDIQKIIPQLDKEVFKDAYAKYN